jgi:hypothetical protein
MGEADETLDDDSETMRNVLRELKTHKRDIQYNSMIEKRQRDKLQKNRPRKA